MSKLPPIEQSEELIDIGTITKTINSTVVKAFKSLTKNLQSQLKLELQIPMELNIKKESLDKEINRLTKEADNAFRRVQDELQDAIDDRWRFKKKTSSEDELIKKLEAHKNDRLKIIRSVATFNDDGSFQLNDSRDLRKFIQNIKAYEKDLKDLEAIHAKSGKKYKLGENDLDLQKVFHGYKITGSEESNIRAMAKQIANVFKTQLADELNTRLSEKVDLTQQINRAIARSASKQEGVGYEYEKTEYDKAVQRRNQAAEDVTRSEAEIENVIRSEIDAYIELKRKMQDASTSPSVLKELEIKEESSLIRIKRALELIKKYELEIPQLSKAYDESWNTPINGERPTLMTRLRLNTGNIKIRRDTANEAEYKGFAKSQVDANELALKVAAAAERDVAEHQSYLDEFKQLLLSLKDTDEMKAVVKELQAEQIQNALSQLNSENEELKQRIASLEAKISPSTGNGQGQGNVQQSASVVQQTATATNDAIQKESDVTTEAVNAEVAKLNELKDKLADVTKAISDKTAAFEDEHLKVTSWLSNEAEAVGKFNDELIKVAESASSIQLGTEMGLATALQSSTSNNSTAINQNDIIQQEKELASVKHQVAETTLEEVNAQRELNAERAKANQNEIAQSNTNDISSQQEITNAIKEQAEAKSLVVEEEKKLVVADDKIVEQTKSETNAINEQLNASAQLANSSEKRIAFSMRDVELQAQAEDSAKRQLDIQKEKARIVEGMIHQDQIKSSPQYVSQDRMGRASAQRELGLQLEIEQSIKRQAEARLESVKAISDMIQEAQIKASANNVAHTRSIMARASSFREGGLQLQSEQNAKNQTAAWKETSRFISEATNQSQIQAAAQQKVNNAAREAAKIAEQNAAKAFEEARARLASKEAAEKTTEALKKQKQVKPEDHSGVFKEYEANADKLLKAYDKIAELETKQGLTGLTAKENEALAKARAEAESLFNVIKGFAADGERGAQWVQTVTKQFDASKAESVKKWQAAYADLAKSLGQLVGKDIRSSAEVLQKLQRYVSDLGGKNFDGFQWIKRDAKGVDHFAAQFEDANGKAKQLNATLNDVDGSLRVIVSDGKASTSLIDDFMSGLGKRWVKLLQYLGTYASFYRIIGTIKQAINIVKELDSAFVELKRISNDSASALEDFRKKSFDLANEVGTTASTITNAAAQWEHLGYNIKDAAILAETSAVYKNIADGMNSDSEATEDLVAIMKAYKKDASEAMDVTDALIAVSNNYAVTAADIGNALKRSAAAMAVANNTFEENVALATAMAEVTQNAEKSGTALQVMSMRIRGAKAELEDMGEDTEGMATSTSKLRAQIKGLAKGFDIMKDEKTFKSTYEIMEGISKVWNDISDVDQAALLEVLAGKVRANQVAALLSNFDQAKKVLDTIAEDEGIALQNNEEKLNTIQGRMTRLSNAGQQLAQDAFNTESIKSFISALTKAVNVLDKFIQKFGVIPTLIGTISAGSTFSKSGGIAGALINAYNIRQNHQNQPVVNPYANVSIGSAQQQAYNMIAATDGIDKAKEALSDLSDEQFKVLEYMRQNNTGMGNAITALGEQARRSGGFLHSFGNTISGVFKQIGLAIANAGIALIVSAIISKMIEFGVAVANFRNTMADLRSSQGEELKQYNKSLDDYKEKINDLYGVIHDENSSIEQVTQARKDLREIQEQIIGMCGNEADALGLVTDAINGQTGALDKLGQKKYNELLDKYANERNSAPNAVGRAIFGLGDKANGRKVSNTAQQEIQASIESYTANLGELYQGLTIPEITEAFKDFERGALDNNITGHVDDIITATENAIDILEKYQNKIGNGISREAYDKYERVLNAALSQARADREGSIELYDMMLQYELLPKDAEYREANRKVQEAQKKFSQAKNTDEENDAIKSFNDVIRGVSGENKERILALFKDLYPVLYAEADKWEFKANITADDETLKKDLEQKIKAISAAVGHTVTQEELSSWNEGAYNSAANDAFNAYAKALGEHGMGVSTGGDYASQVGILSTDSLEALKSKIEQIAGVSFDDLNQDVIATVKNVNNLERKFTLAWNKIGKDVPNGAKKVETALKLVAREEDRTAESAKDLNGADLSDVAKHLSKLSDVYDKLKKDGKVKWDTIDTKDFKEAFGDIEDETGEFEKAFDNFRQTLSSTPNDTQAVQDAFNELASAYVYNSDCMQLLNENNKDLVIGMLSDNGVANATEVVNDALNRKAAAANYAAFSDQLLADEGVDLANVSGETATATMQAASEFLKKADYEEQDRAAIARLILEHWALNGAQIDTSGSCNALADLAAMAGVATSQIIALNNAMAGGTTAATQASGGNFAMLNNGVDSQKANQDYQKAQREYETQKALKDIRQAREGVRFGGKGGSSGGGGGGGGGGGNKEPSKTDKEFDYVNRALQIMQEQNEELREKVDNQYVILQDAEDNAEEFRDAIGRLGEAEQELNALGVYYGEDEFTEFLETLDLSEAADNITSNVEEIEDAYDGLNTILDDTPGYVKPIGVEERIDAAEEKADELQQVIEELFGDPQLAANAVGRGGEGSGETFLGADIKDYDKVVAAAKKYKQALGDVEKARDKTSKTLDENGTGQLTFIKQLQESDKQLIAAYEHAADSYKTEWEDYKEKILEAFKEDGQGEKYIQDIMFGNLDPEEWERMITYDSNDQAAKDRVELLERGQTAYDHQKESLKSMREWQQKLNEDVQKEYEMRLNIVKAEMVAIESRMNEAQHNLDMKEILGEVVQESDYQSLIDITDEQIANYEKQLDVLNEQLDTLDEGEQAWYDCKSQIADCEQSIRDCVKQQAEWNDTILRMPVENISRFLGLVKNLGQTLKNWLSVNDAKGIAQTAEQIQTSWTTAYDQITDDELGLMKQLEDYEELLENYDLGSTKFSEVDDEIQSARDSLESLVEEMIELNKQLLTLPIDKIAEMTTYLDGTMSDLQQVQSDYETTINTVIDLITNETEKIQDEYGELQKKIEDQIKPLQDQLDALEKANEKRDRELQIENALYELEKAREQKTVQVIRNGQVTYEADESAIRNAQQGYEDANYNKLVGELNDQIDALNKQLEDAEKATNDQVDALNDMLKNRWETIMPDTERNRNQEIASQFFMDMFGVSNWKELVLAGKNANGVYADEAIYQGTRAGYEQNSVQMRDTQRQIDINNLITDQLTRLVEDFQADKINSEQLSAKVSTLMGLVADGLITGQERIENTLSLGGYSNLGAVLSDASVQRDNQIGVFYDNLEIAQENRDQVNDIIGRWDDFKVWYDETYQQLYEQYKAIDFIGDTLKDWRDDDDDDDDRAEYGGVWEGSTRNPDEYRGDASLNDIGHYDDGLAKGAIGSMSTSDKFKAIQALGLKKLDPDEFPAILHLGEGVMNRQQQSTMLDNFRSALALGASGSGAVIQMSFGDISLPNVTNGQDFAESLAMQFQPAMNQVFSKIFHR